MKTMYLQLLQIALGAAALAAAAVVVDIAGAAAPPAPPWFTWSTVVNNSDFMPTKGCEEDDTKCRLFNSYNQPSVNERGLVVIRARSRGGQGDTGGVGEGHEAGVTATAADEGNGGNTGGGGSGTEHGNQPVHGIYTRDMSVAGSPIVRILDRKTEVPQPNNAHYPPSNRLLTTFIETPSFPRIDMLSDTVATRGNHQPAWVYEVGRDPDTGEPIETRTGTTGIYTNPFGVLITGASKLGAVPGFEFFAVPGLDAPTMFDVFPGAPAVTGGKTIVFKGNFTVGNVGKTGVFYRDLVDGDIDGGPGGGADPVVLIANNVDTFIPGTDRVFGSTSPPSAANGQVVFAGFDNEDAPTLGGIFLAPLAETPDLTTLVSIGQWVPGESVKATFNNLGEGGAFDGRYVGFWGAWGTEKRTVRLYCPMEGNKDRIAYCSQELVCEDTAEKIGDPNSTCDGTGCWQEIQVPVNQGIFVHDTARGGSTRSVAKTGARFDEFLFWNYSGKTPCTGGGHSEEGAEDDGEPARWRSSAFVAVSGHYTAFKAASVEGEQAACGTCHRAGGKAPVGRAPVHATVEGIYLSKQPGQDVFTVVDTRTAGRTIDPRAPAGSKVTEIGIERESLRGDWLVVNAKMGIEGGTEEDGMAGIYLTRVPRSRGARLAGPTPPRRMERPESRVPVAHPGRGALREGTGH